MRQGRIGEGRGGSAYRGERGVVEYEEVGEELNQRNVVWVKAK